MEPTQKSPSTLSLLVVEDDDDAMEVLLLMIPLKYPGITIYTAGNGKNGVELFRERMPDIVITDIMMPEMDGFQMAEEIKSIKGDTRFIVFTGCTSKTDLAKSSEIGVSDYIVKPIDFNILFAAIEKCMAEIALKRQ